MANRFWIGNSGNWDDTAHWSTTSGGSGGADVPSSTDDAIIDANSLTLAGQTITLDVSLYCKSFDCSTASYPFTIDQETYGMDIEIYGGDFTLRPGLTFLSNGQTIYHEIDGNNTFTTGNNVMAGAYVDIYYINDPAIDTVTIIGNLDVSGGDYGEVDIECNVSLGTTNITADDIEFYGTGSTVNLGSSVLTTTQYLYISDLNSLDAGTSKVIINILNECSLDLIDDFTNLNEVEVNSSNPAYTLYFTSDEGTINTFKINDPCVVKFIATFTYLFENFQATGNATNKIIMNTASGTGEATLSKSSGIVSCDYLDLTNCHAEGGATWYAGSHSTDNGNNTGWLFEDAPVTNNSGFFGLM